MTRRAYSLAIEGDVSPVARSIAFLRDFMDAAEGTDIEFRRAETEDGEAAVVILVGEQPHGFTVDEARVVAEIATEVLAKFPHHSSLSDLVVALRHAADEAGRRLQ